MTSGTFRRVKFPFEVTKGKANDLFRLKFIRRSELEPNVRHFMKHSVRQMGRQLDLWFKEQNFTLGHLTKEQERIFHSCKRLKSEQRRIKKANYVRYQDELREKLQQIRLKLITMKVVRKFKENVQRNKELAKQEEQDIKESVKRNKELTKQTNKDNKENVQREKALAKKENKISKGPVQKDKALALNKDNKDSKEHVQKLQKQEKSEMGKKRPKVDFLRVPGNEVYMYGSSQSMDGNKDNNHNSDNDDGANTKKTHKMVTSATALSKFEVVGNPNYTKGMAEEDRGWFDSKVDNLPDIHKDTDHTKTESAELVTEPVDNYNGGQQQQGTPQSSGGGMAIFGQNLLPSSSRMETIPEENLEEVAVEIDDIREERKLTKRRLALFTRSQSKRNIFDDHEQVPLLPEVSSSRSRLVSRAAAPDTDDKQTQTSLGSGEKGQARPRPKPSSRGRTRVKKTIVVKLPRSKHHPGFTTHREETVKSSTGNYGSGPEPDSDCDSEQVFRDNDDDADGESDADGYILEADVLTTDDEGWEGSDEGSDNSDLSYQENLHISVSYGKPKHSSRKKKTSLASRIAKTDAINDKDHDGTSEKKKYFRVIPDEETFPDSPLLVQRQNPRSMLYKERSFYVAPDIITRPSGSAKYLSSRQLEHLYKDCGDKTEPEKLQEIKEKRLEDIKRRLSRENSLVSPREKESADKNKPKEKEDTASPPGSPWSGSKRSQRNNTNFRRVHTQGGRDYSSHTNAVPRQSKDKGDNSSPQGSKRAQRSNMKAVPRKSKDSVDSSSPPGSPWSGAKRGHRSNVNISMLQSQTAESRDKGKDWKRNHDLSSSDPAPTLTYDKRPSKANKHEVPSLRDQYYRDKLLKAERDSILSQNIKMRRFIDTFDKERVHASLPPIAGGSSGRPAHSTADGADKTIGNFLFKICEPKADGVVRKKIVPSVSTTSLRMLKSCRYLREYTPMTEEERMTSYVTKETSWNMDTRHSNHEDYIANVRLQLF